jgi:hypothetical protein
MAGSIYILPRDRVHPVNIPFTTAMAVFSKWGTGAGEFVRAMKQQDLLVQAQGQPGTTHETTAVLISGKV